MVVYKSRIDSIGKNGKKTKKQKKKSISEIENKYGIYSGKTHKGLTKSILKFADNNPVVAIQIAKEVVEKKPKSRFENGKLLYDEKGKKYSKKQLEDMMKGGGFGKSLAVVGTSAIAGGVAGAIGFREYLIHNPGEAAKLLASGIGQSINNFVGGNISSGGKIRKKRMKKGGILPGEPTIDDLPLTRFGQNGHGIQQIPGGMGRGRPPKLGGSIHNLVKNTIEKVKEIAPKLENVNKAITNKIVEKLPVNIPKVNVDGLDHNVIKHAVLNMTPHEFGLVRGITSGFLNKDHPLLDHIKTNLGGSFIPPPNIHKGAYLDILRAPSPHFLSEMLHNEHNDRKKGMDVGGGLYDAISSVFHKGLSGAQTISRGVVSVGNSINTVLQRGLLIAHALEPLIEIIDPQLGDLYGLAIHNATNLQKGIDTGITGANAINSLLHGDLDNALTSLGSYGEMTGSESIQSGVGKINQIKEGLDKAAELLNVVNNQEKVAELDTNLQILDETGV